MARSDSKETKDTPIHYGSERSEPGLLFRADPGQIPPYLAGRQVEQDAIGETLELLQSGQPNKSLILQGPRGNGKTALLEWTHREIKKHNGIHVWRGFGKDVQANRIGSEFSRFPRLRRWVSGSIQVVGTGGSLEIRDDPDRLREKLVKAARRKPILFLVDEAHAFEPLQAEVFLNAVQSARSESDRIGIILAGTPDLSDQLLKYNVTFSDRPEWLQIGLLPTGSDAADAIRKPLAQAGWTILNDALDRIVQRTDRYPYFIQLYGEELWKRLRTRNLTDRVVRMDDVEAVSGTVESRRNLYYNNRYTEIAADGLLPIIRDLASVFSKSDSIPRDLMTRLVDQSIRQLSDPENGSSTQPLKFPTPHDVEVRLRHIGFMTLDPTTGLWSPGIPSLARYMTTGRGQRSDDERWAARTSGLMDQAARSRAAEPEPEPPADDPAPEPPSAGSKSGSEPDP